MWEFKSRIKKKRLFNRVPMGDTRYHRIISQYNTQALGIIEAEMEATRETKLSTLSETHREEL
jgi:hypothetical protein